MSNEQTPRGVIYDAGYREYAGQYGGRVRAIASLVWDDMKRALGLHRTWGYKLFLYIIILGQFGIFLFMLLSDLLISQTMNTFDVGNAEQLGSFLGVDSLRYYSFFATSTMLLWFLSALGAPWLMCQERKNRVLPLYFARPIKPMDYLLAKGLSIFGLLFTFSGLPVLLLFIFKGALEPNAITYFSENWAVVPAIIASGAAVSIFYASFSMGISSLVESPGFAAGGIIGIPFIAASLFSILGMLSGSPYLQLVDFSNSIVQFITWIFLGEIPPVDLQGAGGGLDEQMAANLEASMEPLAAGIYAIEVLAIALLGWLIAYLVYRNEASR